MEFAVFLFPLPFLQLVLPKTSIAPLKWFLVTDSKARKEVYAGH